MALVLNDREGEPAREVGMGEVEALLARGRDGEAGDRDVDAALFECVEGRPEVQLAPFEMQVESLPIQFAIWIGALL